MKVERSKLAELVIAYHARFGSHVPEPTLRRVDAGHLVALIQGSLASGVPLSEADWGWIVPRRYGPGGCIVRFENPERAAPKRGPDGRWRK
jgi:hypothetical protein